MYFKKERRDIMNSILSNFVTNANKLTLWLGNIVSYLIYPLVGLLAIEAIILRSLLNKPTIWSQELALFIFGGYFMLGAGYCLKSGGFVAMDAIYNHMNYRIRFIVDILIFLSMSLISIIIIWFGSKWVWMMMVTGERSETLWSPILWPVRLMIPLGAGILLLQSVANFVAISQNYLTNIRRNKK